MDMITSMAVRVAPGPYPSYEMRQVHQGMPEVMHIINHVVERHPVLGHPGL